RRRPVEVPLDAELRPVVHLLLNEVARRTRLKPQRMAAQVHRGFPVAPARQQELLAEGRQGVVGVQAPGERFVRLEGYRRGWHRGDLGEQLFRLFDLFQREPLWRIDPLVKHRRDCKSRRRIAGNLRKYQQPDARTFRPRSDSAPTPRKEATMIL